MKNRIFFMVLGYNRLAVFGLMTMCMICMFNYNKNREELMIIYGARGTVFSVVGLVVSRRPSLPPALQFKPKSPTNSTL